MSFIREIKDLGQVKTLTRSVRILPADEVLGASEIRFELALMNEEKLSRINKQFKKDDDEEMTPEESKAFKRAIVVAAVKGWSGVNNTNVRRLCDFFLTYPEYLDEANTGDWEFNTRDLAVVGEYLNMDSFNKIVRESMDLQAFSNEVLTREKKELKSS